MLALARFEDNHNNVLLQYMQCLHIIVQPWHARLDKDTCFKDTSIDLSTTQAAFPLPLPDLKAGILPAYPTRLTTPPLCAVVRYPSQLCLDAIVADDSYCLSFD